MDRRTKQLLKIIPDDVPPTVLDRIVASGITAEQLHKIARQAFGRTGGLARAARCTPERLSEIASMGAAAAARKRALEKQAEIK